MHDFGIVFDPVFKRHITGPGHPERPERLDAIGSGLEWSGVLSTAYRIQPEPVERALLERIHTREYIDRVAECCRLHHPLIDEHDCSICGDSYEIALLAAGSVVKAARYILRGELKRAFCAARPPGHHAERDRAMGFCLFANVALAAEAAKHEFGLERVLIVDWDVHHGNGTQHIFEADPAVLFVSLHGHPSAMYPGTGYAEEVGVGAGKGFTLNLPMMPGSGDVEYREAFERHVIPAADRFGPQLVIISAGFDAHADDPLGNTRVSDDGFVWMLRQLMALSDRHCGGRLLSVLEGGYNLDVLKRCVTEHVRMLAGE